MNITLQDVLRITGGSIEGAEPTTISGICSLEEPKKDCIAFTQAGKSSLLPDHITKTELALLIVPEKYEVETESPFPLLRVADPFRSAIALIPLFHPERSKPEGVSEQAWIHPEAAIGENVRIGPFCSVDKGVVIGKDTTLYPHVTIYEGVTLGEGVTVHSQAVIREHCQVGDGSVIQNGAIVGADGFGYIPDPELGIRPVPQVGIVKLEERVDIGANSCVDRAALGTTVIGKASKLDNLVQIGHNVKVGAMSIICALVGIGGSTKVGNRVTLGGHTGVADHVSIGDDIRVGGKSGVIHSLEEKGDYMGMPIQTASQWRRRAHVLRKLPELASKVNKLMKKL